MPVPDSSEPVDRHLLRDTAYDALCGAIVDGTLAPGEALHDNEICGWLGLSRTPVRDALSRLRDEGLVESAPQRFTKVAPLSVRDVHEVVPVVAALHCLATELAVPRLTPAKVQELRVHNEAYVRALQARDEPAAYKADDRFHDVFVDACGNPEIRRLLTGLNPRLRRVEHLGVGQLPGGRLVSQHQAMMTRAEMGDAPGAAGAARANWMTLGLVLERGFKSAR